MRITEWMNRKKKRGKRQNKRCLVSLKFLSYKLWKRTERISNRTICKFPVLKRVISCNLSRSKKDKNILSYIDHTGQRYFHTGQVSACRCIYIFWDANLYFELQKSNFLHRYFISTWFQFDSGHIKQFGSLNISRSSTCKISRIQSQFQSGRNQEVTQEFRKVCIVREFCFFIR